MPVPGREDCGAVVDMDAVDPLQGKHRPAGAQPIDAGHPEIRVAREIFAELGRGRCLETQIHLDLTTSASVSTTSTGFNRRSAG